LTRISLVTQDIEEAKYGDFNSARPKINRHYQTILTVDFKELSFCLKREKKKKKKKVINHKN
jgi:hypothetical protein